MAAPARPSRWALGTLQARARLRAVGADVWVAFAIGVIALALRLAPLGAFSREYDEGVYWQSLRAMAAGHRLFSQVFSSQPPLFLLAVYPFYRFLGQSLTAARLAMVAFSLLGLVSLYLAARLLTGRWAALAALALLAADPLYLRESHTVQAEAPALGMMALGVALALLAARATSPGRRAWLALVAGVALGAALMIKLFAVVALPPAALALALPPLASADGAAALPATWRAAWRMARGGLVELGLALAGLVAACLAALLPFAGSWPTLYAQVVAFHLAAESAAQQGLRARAALLAGTLLPWALLPAALLALALALAIWQRAWRPFATLAVPLLWLAGAVLLLLRQQPLFNHDLSAISPPLALVAAVALALAWRAPVAAEQPRLPIRVTPERLRALALALWTLALLVGGVAGARSDARDVAYVPTEQLLMAIALRQTTLPGDIVITDDPYVAALAGRDVPPQLVDTSAVRIASGSLTAPTLERIITRTDARTILFASGRFQSVPGFATWVRQRFEAAVTFGGGRVLYVKAPPGPRLI